MMLNTTTNLPGSPGQIDSPRCANCHTAMRHSCTEDLAPEGERRIYQCVTCGSTQILETAAGYAAAEPAHHR